MTKKFILLSLIIVPLIAILSYVYFLRPTNDTTTTPQSSDNQSTQSTNQELDAIDSEFPSQEGPKLLIGNNDAPVVIKEFIDYKCPNCGMFHRTVKKQIEASYSDRVVFEVHQTPFIGPDSGRAARGAYCSAIHGDIFEGYNDAVFTYMYDNYFSSSNFQSEYEDILTDDVLSILYTQAEGDSEDAFRECIADKDKINLYINADQLLAAENELRGTPSFVIGDTSLVGPQQYSIFKALIEAEL